MWVDNFDLTVVKNSHIRSVVSKWLRSICILITMSFVVGCVKSTDISMPKNAPSQAATANFDLAIGYISQNRLLEAEEKLKKAISFEPNYYEAYNALGVIYEESSAWRRALLSFEKAAQKPDYYLAKLNYARLLCSVPGQSEVAIVKGAKLFEAVGKNLLGTNAATALTGAGICYKKNHQRATAELRFTDALRFSPGFPAALLELADLYYKNGKEISAKTHLQSYLAATSTPSTYAKQLAANLGMRL